MITSETEEKIKRLFSLYSLIKNAKEDYKNLLAEVAKDIDSKLYNGEPFKFGTDFEFIKTKYDQVYLRKTVK